MHEVLVNRLGGLSLPRKSVVRLTDLPDMTKMFTVDVKQQCNNNYSKNNSIGSFLSVVIRFKCNYHLHDFSRADILNLLRIAL